MSRPYDLYTDAAGGRGTFWLVDGEFGERDGADLDFAPWDGRRVPVTLLGGYLGAGKTTLLNDLLARTDRQIAVLVNDIGSVNIDAALIRRRSADTIELTDGCMCCSMAEGVTAAFDAVRSRETPPDHVIVELSGAADPGRVTFWGDGPGFRLDGVVVLVDADQFEPMLSHPIEAHRYRTQIAAADVVMLTKLDLVDPEHERRVRDQLAKLEPDLTVGSGELAGALLDSGTRRRSIDATPPATLFDAHEVTTIPMPDPIHRAELDGLLGALPSDVLRAKGIARLDDGTKLLVQVVGRRCEVIALPMAEDHEPTGLVVISPPRS